MQSSDNCPTKSKRCKIDLGSDSERRIDNIFKQVWTHYKRLDDYLAFCSYCKEAVFYKTSTWYMVAHLKSAHKNFKAPTPEITHIKVENEWNSPSVQKYVKVNPEQQKQTDRDLLELFINDYHSFSIVEESAFRKFVKNIPGYVLPDVDTITSVMIPNLYEETLIKLKEIVAYHALSVSLTVELWSAAPKEKYLAVTAHFIDKEYNRKQVLIGCKGLGDRPNKTKICDKLKKLIENWGLESKVLLVITDNDENVEQAIESIGWVKRRCNYQPINSIFMQAIKEMQIYTKIKKIIHNFNMSSMSTDMLKSYQIGNMADRPPKTFVQDNLLCWTSIIEMMERFLELREAIQTCVDLVGKHWPVISEQDWEKVDQFCDILNLFKQAINVLIKDQFSPASVVIVVINNLKSVCDTFLENDFFNYLHLEVKDLIKDIRDGLHKLPDYESDTTLNVCTLLDPRYKTIVFKNEQTLRELKSNVRILIVSAIDKRNLNFIKSEPNDDDSMTWEKLSESPAPVAVREMENYFGVTYFPERDEGGQWNDPAQWWKNHKSLYPNLAQVYRSQCHIVATNIKYEEQFSKSGLRNLKRNNLNEQLIEKLAFLNANLDPNRFD
ncbi:hypothetical protein O3G_MSEX012356 [Manduca sexta]|uniref:BED-type domain-containing protein n=1 Tax=Manduca sexta TaxID=7130 RepID=A0A922CWZ8_MANSE|nr:hypothetical protein O3G_MSEX012356 [Manduca sexta]